jgi:hypothetical protein
MTEIEWSAPQDKRRRTSQNLKPKADELRSRPGHWGVVATGLTKTRTEASSLAVGIRRSKYAAFKPVGAWESRSSGSTVWARYVGENGEFKNVGEVNEVGEEADTTES